MKRKSAGGNFTVRITCLGLAIASFAGLELAAVKASAQPPAMVAVTQVVESSDLAAAQTFVGNATPLRHSTVGSAVGGRVVEFLVNEGDHVAKRQPLARLLTRAVEIQRDAALAELEFRQQELNELTTGSRPEEKAQAKARLLASKALMEYSKKKLQRTRAMAEKHAASTDQLEDDASAAERNAQVYLEAKAAHELIEAGPRKEKIEQARARVKAAQEEVNRLEDQLEKHTIFSPFDGYVTKEYTEVGQWIASGEPVVEVIEVDWIEVDVMVLETFISELRREAPARVEFDALPGRSFEGEIARIVPQADVRSRSFPVKVRLQNELLPDGTPLLKSGMFARVSLPAASRQSVLLVPKDALVLGGKETQVYTVTPADPKKPHEGKAEPVAVIIGVAYKGLVEVRGPLKAGQWVVVEGNERLQAGQSVVMMPTKTKNGSKQPGGGAKDAARNEDRQPVATANPAGPAKGTDKR